MITKKQYKILKNVSNGVEIDFKNQETFAVFDDLHKNQFIVVKNSVFALSGKGYQAIDHYIETKREKVFKWVSFFVTAISATAAVIAALK